MLVEVGMVEDALEHRRHQEGRRHPVLLHQAQPLSGVEAGLHHGGVARCKVPSTPMTPPTWKIGTHIMLDGRWRVRVERRGDPVIRALERALADGDRLRQPGRAAGEQDQRVAVVAFSAVSVARAARRRRQIGRPSTTPSDGLLERGGEYGSPATPTGAAPGRSRELPANSRRRQGGFISAAAAPMRAAPSIVAIDARLPTSTTATRDRRPPRCRQGGGAAFDRRGQLAVAEIVARR